MEDNIIEQKHNKYAPYWASALLVFALSGLSTVWLDTGKFCEGYLLDITGPAWNYILFRGLYTVKADNKWTRFFTSGRTLIIFILITFTIEILQYLNVYQSKFDPFDLLAYISLLIPLYIIDRYQHKSLSY